MIPIGLRKIPAPAAERVLPNPPHPERAILLRRSKEASVPEEIQVERESTPVIRLFESEPLRLRRRSPGLAKRQLVAEVVRLDNQLPDQTYKK